ncbi:MAG TPA: S9 family peptidase [Thermomicrobiaceae bacterium]|nr:S9 family peptidase [Thermomicrobiaceae bacterium]
MTRPIEIEDLARIRYVGDPRISPDGRRLAYVVTEVDLKGKQYRSAIWLAATDGSERARFTAGTAKDTAPRWSPDGRHLAFLSDRDGNVQLYVMPADGGEPQRLTDLKNGVADPVWSPDGSQLAFSSKLGPEGMVLRAEQSDEDRRREAEKSDVKVIRSLKYKFDGEGFLGDLHRHLFVVPAGGGRPRQLTDGDWDDSQHAWSADGSEIAFVSNRTPDRERNSVADIWTVPLDGGEPRRVTASDGAYGTPAYSPDGKHLAYVGNPVAPPYGPTTLAGLWVVPAAGGDARNLTAALDREVGNTVTSDVHYVATVQRPLWSTDGTSVTVPISDRGSVRVVQVGLDGEIRTLLDGARDIVTVSRADDGRLGFTACDTTHPIEAFAADADGRDERALSHANDEFLHEVEVRPAEHFTFTGEGGQELDGWLITPHGFRDGVRYPLVLEIHGGPHGMYGNTFFHEMQVLAAAGYVVLYTNPRGSTGQGQQFVSAAMGDWGGVDYRDIMAGVDHVLGLGFVDQGRLGLTGGSYGGYMTNWIVGHTDRFRAAATDRCTANRFSQFGASDFAWSSGPWEFGGTPYDNPDGYMERSPITYIKHVTAPMLIIHSEQDHRCPIEEGEQWFVALRLLGKEAEMLRFPNESHGMSRTGRPDHRIERLTRLAGWFDEHL